MKNISLSPHFHEVTMGQTWVSSDGESQLSLRQVPTTETHYAQKIESTGRGAASTFDIDEQRAGNAESIARITEEYNRVCVVESESGSHVEVRVVNRGVGRKTIGVLTSWSTDAEWENEKGIVEALALEYPEHQIAFVVTPGMGQSSRVTKEHLTEMKKTGSFAPMAEEMASAISGTKLDGSKVVLDFDAIVGISEGGRVAISLAEQLGVKKVVTIDPPGTTEQSVLTFAKHFGIDEGKGQKAVLENTPDIIMATAHREVDSKLLAKQGLAALRRDLFARAKVMARAGLAEDVKRATNAGVTIVDYRASASTFADTQVAADIAKSTPGYNAVILEGAPHGVVEGSPYAVVALVRQAFGLISSKS